MGNVTQFVCPHCDPCTIICCANPLSSFTVHTLTFLLVHHKISASCPVLRLWRAAHLLVRSSDLWLGLCARQQMTPTLCECYCPRDSVSHHRWLHPEYFSWSWRTEQLVWPEKEKKNTRCNRYIKICQESFRWVAQVVDWKLKTKFLSINTNLNGK